MAEDKKELTPEEKREKQREVALGNLNNQDLLNLAGAYFVTENGKYGEAGESAVEQFKYTPSMKSETAHNIIIESLIGSRQGNRRYTGQVNEYGIIETAGKQLIGGFAGVKVSDAMALMGSKAKVNPKYADKFISELLAEDATDEEKELGKVITGLYTQRFTDLTVSEALNARADAGVSGLEKVLAPKKKE